MKHYRKKHKKHVKQEKRIVKLLFQKGLIHDFNIDKKYYTGNITNLMGQN